MKLSNVCLSFVVCGFLAACGAQDSIDDDTLSQQSSALKGTSVPFSAEFFSRPTSPPAPNPLLCGVGFPVFSVVQAGDGKASHLGKVDVSITSCANITTSPPTLSDVVFTLEAANGDSLVIRDFVVEGGTGRFADATGSVTGYYVPAEGGGFINYLDGEINY